MQNDIIRVRKALSPTQRCTECVSGYSRGKPEFLAGVLPDYVDECSWGERNHLSYTLFQLIYYFECIHN